MAVALVHRIPIGAIIEGMSAREQLAAGSAAMAQGEWATARDEFRSAWSETESADALDGVGRALWWLNDPAGSLELRARAFALFRRERRDAEATAVALWLARQYRSLYRRTELADGWLARARSLLSGLRDQGSLPGWLLLAEAEIGPPRPQSADTAGLAVAIGREHGDRDLEIVALSRRGACRVSCWDSGTRSGRPARGDGGSHLW